MALENLSIWDANGDGIADVCFNAPGDTFFTAGADGNIKTWSNLKETSTPKTIKVGETIYGLVVKDESVYVASDNNAVDEYSLSDSSHSGVLFRFTANPTHVALSESQNLIAAGSSDFTAKLVDLDTNEQKDFVGHKAPILSVAIDPVNEYLATTSCDGNFRLWNLMDSSVVETIGIVKPSNDIGNSESLCRMSWRPATGEDIAVPSGNCINVYSRDTWILTHSFQTPSKPFNCCNYSPCGRFLAGATVDGFICIWDTETQECLQTLQHSSKASICSVVWNPKEDNTLAITNVKGQVGLLQNAVPANPVKKSVPDDLEALFENEDGKLDEFFDDDAVESNTSQPSQPNAEPAPDAPQENPFDDDFDIPSTNQLLAANDDLAPPTIPTIAKLQEDDATSSVSELLGDKPAQDPKRVYEGPAPTPMQPPFQSSATPEHLSHRFMVWNSVGVIRSYTDETESAIDVEFHDKQHHYALHFNNESPEGGSYHTLADLSMNAVAFAAESLEDVPSKLTVTYYATWEGNKEWNIYMPDGEEIKAITIGESWVAVCTDARLVRMFSLAGMQRFIFSIPGPVVSMAAHTDQLMVVYHSSQGFNGNQSLGYMLLEVGLGTGANRARKIVGGEPLSVSKKSTLQWLGFSAEGTPVTVDSSGVVRMMNRGFCNSWIPVLYLDKLTKSRYDHYWVIALHENPQDVRAVLCKGSRYPSTIPRPFPSVLQYKLPLCEDDSEKSKLEEEYWRTRLFSSHTDFLEAHGFEMDEAHKREAKVLMQHSLMKMFALACKSDKESRALEIGDLMPTSSAVNLTIKYASRVKKMVLAQKLGEIAQEKTQEEMLAVMKMQRSQQQIDSDDGEEEDQDVDDFRQKIQAGYSHTSTEWADHKKATASTQQQDANAVSSTSTQATDADDLPDLPRKPSLGTATTRNPFKAVKPSTSAATTSSSPGSAKSDSASGSKVTSVLDSIPRKSAVPKQRGVIPKSHSVSKKPRPKDGKKQQTLLGSKSKFRLTSTPKGKATTVEDPPSVNQQVLKDIRNEFSSGVMLYVSETREGLADENPDLDGMEVRKLAISNFKKLTPDERQAWNARAKTAPAGGAKRKLQDEENGEEAENFPAAKSKKSESQAADPSARLAAFAYESEG